MYLLSFIGDSVFQQAILSPTLPECIKVFQTADKALLPSEYRGLIQYSLHVWVVTEEQWSQLALPRSSKTEVVSYLTGIFKKLQYSLKVPVCCVNCHVCL